jgi:hypothetical protein
MKRVFIYIAITSTVLVICFFLGMRIWIGNDIKERIKIAKELYPGTAEDALIAYLLDEKNSTQARTDVAIWTLGQIRSRKALPVLYGLYKHDPEGKTCKGRHSQVLCQYGIHKAIVSIENNWLGAKEKNWFGSWSRLNK